VGGAAWEVCGVEWHGVGSMGVSGIEQHGVWWGSMGGGWGSMGGGWGSMGGGWGRAACGVLPITKVTLTQPAVWRSFLRMHSAARTFNHVSDRARSCSFKYSPLIYG